MTMVQICLTRNKKVALSLVRAFNAEIEKARKEKGGNVGASNAWYSKGIDSYGHYYWLGYEVYWPRDQDAINKAEQAVIDRQLELGVDVF